MSFFIWAVMLSSVNDDFAMNNVAQKL